MEEEKNVVVSEDKVPIMVNTNNKVNDESYEGYSEIEESKGPVITN